MLRFVCLFIIFENSFFVLKNNENKENKFPFFFSFENNRKHRNKKIVFR